MLREAELFVMAEVMLVEVLSRVRPQDQDIVLPELATRADRPLTIAEAVADHLAEDAQVPGVLAGGEVLPSGGPASSTAATAEDACDAARKVVDGEAVVVSVHGELSARAFLLRSTMARSLLAHYVAAYLGSTACPLPEELARPLWELTAPEAPAWRALGWFHDPMALPPHVSWRDRFLLDAGHQPHPLGH